MSTTSWLCHRARSEGIVLRFLPLWSGQIQSSPKKAYRPWKPPESIMPSGQLSTSRPRLPSLLLLLGFANGSQRLKECELKRAICPPTEQGISSDR